MKTCQNFRSSCKPNANSGKVRPRIKTLTSRSRCVRIIRSSSAMLLLTESRIEKAAKSHADNVANRLINTISREAPRVTARLIPNRITNMHKMFPKTHFRQIETPQVIDTTTATAIPKKNPASENALDSDRAAMPIQRYDRLSGPLGMVLYRECYQRGLLTQSYSKCLVQGNCSVPVKNLNTSLL